MLRRLAKIVGYSKAPKRTFAVLHPLKAAKWGAALWLVKKLFSSDRKGRKATA